ncbi:hypothetical protein IPJ72_03920 [Candidatus Peregrinibacteria bacterium]|nr:MAG: hypothetical protein IPJ72_03920 [Candidatus Peregrinibacteria bacterium]
MLQHALAEQTSPDPLLERLYRVPKLQEQPLIDMAAALRERFKQYLDVRRTTDSITVMRNLLEQTELGDRAVRASLNMALAAGHAVLRGTSEEQLRILRDLGFDAQNTWLVLVGLRLACDHLLSEEKMERAA